MLDAGVESFAARRRHDGRDAPRRPRGARRRTSCSPPGARRTPRSSRLERAGVETDRGYVVVDDRQRTNVEGIWAAGDVAIGPQFTPAAQYQARIAVEDMFGAADAHADYSVMPTAIFTDPGARLGRPDRAGGARAPVTTSTSVKHPLPNVTRAQYTRTKHGLFKIVFDTATRKVLGVHVVSRGASDIVGGLAPALQLGVTVDDLAYMHHVYPSYSEGLKAAAEKALA